MRQRSSIDFSSLTIAVSYTPISKKVITAIGSADPKPVVWEFIFNHETDVEEIIHQNIKKVRMVDNDFFSRDYRKDVLKYKLTEIYNILNKI